ILVIIFSVVVIYNIFQVGITQKIWEYGKIKALGASKKQLKSIILKEGMYLAFIGIPIGEFLGFVIAKVAFQWINRKSEMINEISMIQVSLFSIPIILAVAFLSLFTVWLALKKPMKIVSSVSSVDAMRYQENTGTKRSIRKGKTKVNVKNLMLANLASNKRRTCSTILTMGLSCVLFVVMANFVGNMDEEYDARSYVEKGQFYISLDYSMNDKAYPENNLDNILKNNPFNQETVEKIRNLNGVTNVYTRKIFTINTKENGPMSVSVLNREDFNRLSEGSTLGVLDYDKASKENAILFGWLNFVEDYGYTINQEVSMKVEDGREIEAPLIGSFGSLDTDWAITEDTYKTWNLEEEHIGYVWVDCEQKDIATVEKELDDLFLGTGHIETLTYKEVLQTSNFNMQFMKLLGYTFLAIIGLIGFMNMANTMITSIIIRKQEFGVLQAIGMSNKQLNRMLQAEGLIFTIGTVIVSLIVGIPLGYGIFLYGKTNGWIGLNIYHFPIIEVVIMLGILLGLQGVLSFILSRNIKKESLVERIRYQG
ncbi:ABC transporter permease, partial [Anaerosporobacter sp.]